LDVANDDGMKKARARQKRAVKYSMQSTLRFWLNNFKRFSERKLSFSLRCVRSWLRKDYG